MYCTQMIVLEASHFSFHFISLALRIQDGCGFSTGLLYFLVYVYKLDNINFVVFHDNACW